MSPIIVEVAALGNIVGMGIVDEVFDFFAVLLVVFGLVFVFDFGFNVEESSAVVLAPLAAMALYGVSVVRRLPRHLCARGSSSRRISEDGGTHMLDVVIIVVVIFLFLFFVIVIVSLDGPVFLIILIAVFVVLGGIAGRLRRALGGTLIIVVIVGGGAACAAIVVSSGALGGLGIVLVVGDVARRRIEVVVVFRIGIARELEGGAGRHFDGVDGRFGKSLGSRARRHRFAMEMPRGMMAESRGRSVGVVGGRDKGSFYLESSLQLRGDLGSFNGQDFGAVGLSQSWNNAGSRQQELFPGPHLASDCPFSGIGAGIHQRPTCLDSKQSPRLQRAT